MRPALAAWLALSLLLGTGAQEACGDPPAARSQSVAAPQLSPEEQLSPHMPESLRCDACQAIAFQIEEQLSRAEQKVGRKALKESDYMEVLERSCSQGWERLSKMCHGYVGERGEAQVYEAHRRGPAALRELLCGGDKGPCARGKAGAAPAKARQNEL
ncbi:marginal zone B and B1 cell specific protein [Willisornis vidua]|uniref:Marginal zone B and B1 cell specific protein n=1 Tax=Willisornis vidua TaxID=1566151 RepID=A0ABQ9D3M3_9PASS|nr:marginal zone B and B1 cell specific protein [Willisornis vidua]